MDGIPQWKPFVLVCLWSHFLFFIISFTMRSLLCKWLRLVCVGAEIAVHLGQEDKVGECVRVNREKVIWEDQEKEKRRES